MVFKPSIVPRPLTEPPAAKAAQLADIDIVQGIFDGEEWAADALYDRVQPVLDRRLRRILRTAGPDYEDVMQAAFERIVTVLSKKPLQGDCDLRAWSAAVATHVALDALRRRVRERKLFQEELAAGFERPVHHQHLEARLEARSEVSRLQAILARMKPHAAETLLLHDVLGYELTEVARLTGASVASAQSRLVRSRGELLRRANKKGSA